MLHVQAASSVVDRFPGRLVLLGIHADRPETQYGWIEPADALDLTAAGPVFSIRRFWKKPSSEMAVKLWRQGFLWNSFVIVARLIALLNLFARALCPLYVSFGRILSFLETAREREIIDELYNNIESVGLLGKNSSGVVIGSFSAPGSRCQLERSRRTDSSSKYHRAIRASPEMAGCLI
jgi:mannose-1-phosphate guanylyltransferase